MLWWIIKHLKCVEKWLHLTESLCKWIPNILYWRRLTPTIFHRNVINKCICSVPQSASKQLKWKSRQDLFYLTEIDYLYEFLTMQQFLLSAGFDCGSILVMQKLIALGLSFGGMKSVKTGETLFKIVPLSYGWPFCELSHEAEAETIQKSFYILMMY